MRRVFLVAAAIAGAAAGVAAWRRYHDTDPVAERAEAWADTDLMVDAVPGRGSGFSLDNAMDRHFVLRPPTCAA